VNSKRSTSHSYSHHPEDGIEARKREAARMVRRALDAEDASHSVVAVNLGIRDPSKFSKMIAENGERHLPFHQVLGLPPNVLRHILGEVADTLGLAVVELPGEPSTADDLRMLARAQRETGDAVASGLDAMADGHITRSEGAKIEAECDEAIAAFLVLRERARQAQREGVVGLRRGAA
jgi:hypothetical protein